MLWILIVAGLFWYGQNQFMNRQSSTNTGQVMFDMPGNGDDVRRIVIDREDETVAMTLKDGIWFLETENPLGEDRAIQQNASALAVVLDGLEVGLVSTNEKNHTNLGIDDNLAGRVSYYSDANAEPIVILRFSNLNSRHVRQDKMVNVYEWSSELGRIVSSDQEMWVEQAPMVAPEATE